MRFQGKKTLRATEILRGVFIRFLQDIRQSFARNGELEEKKQRRFQGARSKSVMSFSLGVKVVAQILVRAFERPSLHNGTGSAYMEDQPGGPRRGL